MEYRRLGSTGMRVSAISLGAWLTYGSDNVEFRNAENCVRTAIDNGVNFIDVADIYAIGQAESAVGKFIAPLDRTHLVLSTKAFWPMSEDPNDKGLSRKHLMESVEKSLKRLGTDYIDIFFCHRYDKDTPTEETVRAIVDLIRQGKILYWGTSMWEANQIEEAVRIAKQVNAYAPVVEQPLYNMLDRQVVEGVLEKTLADKGIGLVVWSPLAQGLLTGKYDKSIPKTSRAAKNKRMSDNFVEHRIESARKISAIADDLGVTSAALALAWALAHPSVDSVITGATKPAHVIANLKALDIEITAELESRIEEALDNRPADSIRHIAQPDQDLPAL
ncbi:aldo/keto reductase family protein [Anaerolineales bacterium]